MKRVTPYFFVFLLLILFFEVLLIFPESVEVKPVQKVGAAEPSFFPEDQQQAEQKMEGVHLVESRGGERDWELWAEEALGFQKKGLWQLRQVKVAFFSENENRFVVTGNTGNVKLNSKDMRIEGDVVIRSTNGYVISTDSVVYSSKERVLKTEDPVSIVGARDKNGSRLKMVGVGFIATINDSKMTLLDQVRGSLPMFNDGKLVKIRSRRAELSGKLYQASFYERVVIDVETLRITGPEAEFQYKENSDVVDSIMVRNGAKVSDVDKWASADQVHFEFKKNKFTFTGQPRLVQGEDELLGDEIVFLDGGKRVTVKRAKAQLQEERLGETE